MAMVPKITPIAGAADVEGAAQRLNSRIRRRLTWMLRGTDTRLLEAEVEGSDGARLLVLSARSTARAPGATQMHRLVRHVQEAVDLLVTCATENVGKAWRLLRMRSVVHDTDAFVASVVEGAEDPTVLTFGFKGQRLQFLLTPSVSVLASAHGDMHVVVKPHCGFHIR